MYTPVNVVKTSTSLVFTCNFFTQTIVFSGDNCIQNKFMKNYSGVIEPTIIRWFSSFFSNKDIFDGVCVGEYTMYLEYTEHSPQYSFQSNRVQFHKPLTGEVIFVSKKDGHPYTLFIKRRKSKKTRTVSMVVFRGNDYYPDEPIYKVINMENTLNKLADDGALVFTAFGDQLVHSIKYMGINRDNRISMTFGNNCVLVIDGEKLQHLIRELKVRKNGELMPVYM